LLGYDSDASTCEQAAENSLPMQAQTAMDTDPGADTPPSSEMDATYFQCRAARL
jgi:hypothetical protein